MGWLFWEGSEWDGDCVGMGWHLLMLCFDGGVVVGLWLGCRRTVDGLRVINGVGIEGSGWGRTL